MRLLGLSIIVTGLALPAPAVALFAWELVAADRCLDAGGSFDYACGECDMLASHPFVPFGVRHPGLVATFPALAAGGVVLVVLGGIVRARASRRAG